MTEQDSGDASWWSSFSMATGETAHARIGPLDLWIQRHPNEWRLARDEASDPMDATLSHPSPVADQDLNELPGVERFAMARTGDRVTLGAALADRPVISRPEKPFHLPVGEEATVFVSTPLWLRFQVGEADKLLREFPIARPSDTWFGPNTLEGELCYTSRAYFVLNHVFYAHLMVQREEEVVPMDCRPSDGMVMAVENDAPVFVTATLMDRAGSDGNREELLSQAEGMRPTQADESDESE